MYIVQYVQHNMFNLKRQETKSADITHRSRRSDTLKRANIPPHGLRLSETGELSPVLAEKAGSGECAKILKTPLFPR